MDQGVATALDVDARMRRADVGREGQGIIYDGAFCAQSFRCSLDAQAIVDRPPLSAPASPSKDQDRAIRNDAWTNSSLERGHRKRIGFRPSALLRRAVLVHRNSNRQAGPSLFTDHHWKYGIRNQAQIRRRVRPQLTA